MFRHGLQGLSPCAAKYLWRRLRTRLRSMLLARPRASWWCPGRLLLLAKGVLVAGAAAAGAAKGVLVAGAAAAAGQGRLGGVG